MEKAINPTVQNFFEDEDAMERSAVSAGNELLTPFMQGAKESDDLLNEVLANRRDGGNRFATVSTESEGEKEEPAPASQPKKDEEQEPTPQQYYDLLNRDLQESKRQYEHTIAEQKRQLDLLAAQRTAPTAPAEERIDWDALGVPAETVDALDKFFSQKYGPAIRQLGDNQRAAYVQSEFNRFDSALAHAQSNYKDFEKYYPKDGTRQWAINVLQQNPNAFRQVNWDQEFHNIYAAADYKRLQAENAELKTKAEKAAERKDAQRKEQKKDLRSIPNNSQRGTAGGGNVRGIAEFVASRPKRESMKSFGHAYLAHLNG